MSILKKLKSIVWLRRIVKDLKINKEYHYDSKYFCKYYMEKADRNEDFEYRMLMFVHNLEKGMCMPNPRPFGKEKVIKLMDMVQRFEKNTRNKNKSCYKMSLSVLYQWLKLYEKNQWKDELTTMVSDFLSERITSDIIGLSGSDTYSKQELTQKKDSSFDTILKTRKSVRNYKNCPLDDQDVMDCIELAQTAPTACNRQMIEIIQVSDRLLCNLISDTIYGSGGITRDSVTYFVITYDIKSLDYYGERNQGYLNAGLTAMNFVNALHSRGIGSCFLQWANSDKEDRKVKKALEISDNKKIAIVIAAGYYDDNSVIARSHRKEIDEIYRKL